MNGFACSNIIDKHTDKQHGRIVVTHEINIKVYILETCTLCVLASFLVFYNAKKQYVCL